MEFIRRELKQIKNIGETLKTARKKKNVSLLEAEEETKVRVKYLEALEEGRYEILPAKVYTVGFLSKYAEFLEINKEPLIKQFMAERGSDGYLKKLVPERKIKEPLFSITPKIVIGFGVVVAVLAILGYIFFNVHEFNSPPALEISSPSTEEVIHAEEVAIIGKTDGSTTLYINNQTVPIDANGNFNQIVKLSQGLNSFEIKSINQLNKEQIKIIKILAEY
jgi:cytoskeletal protein RodZ